MLRMLLSCKRSTCSSGNMTAEGTVAVMGCAGLSTGGASWLRSGKPNVALSPSLLLLMLSSSNDDNEVKPATCSMHAKQFVQFIQYIRSSVCSHELCDCLALLSPYTGQQEQQPIIG